MYLSSKKRYRSRRNTPVSSKTKKQMRRTASERMAITDNGYYILKWIACITLLIDNIALFFQAQCNIDPNTYVTMRYIGRMAFPIFAYLLVERFHNLKKKGRYLLGLGVLALISEIPYDFINISQMPVEGKILNLNYQNMYLSLFISFLLLMMINANYDRIKAVYNNSKFGKLTEINLKIIFFGLAAGAAFISQAEYSFGGVLFVLLLNFARGKKHKQIFQALAFLIFALTRAHIAYLILLVPFALIVILEYSARTGTEKDNAILRFIRSKFSRRLTSVFYPLHMVILIAIRMAMVW